VAPSSQGLGLDDLVLHEDSGVYVLPQEGTAATYLDGAELYLLEALRSARDVGVFSPDLRGRVKDWASLYHLTPYRATILDALGLENTSARVLELGAGCGAVTRWLGEHFESVDAVEGSLARARVARERCRDLESVRVAAANFFDLDFGGAYDVATLIGVLEYSHLYHPEFRHDPARAAASNLELVRGSLAEDGMLVIAIENKFGLKYLSGSHEDHAARRFEGIEGYPSRSSAVTFSAVELSQLIAAAGFTGCDFYLPFPDYKLASTVLDAAAADAATYPANWVEAPFPDRAGPRHPALFNESLALRELVPAGLLRDLANSFLVLAYNGDRGRVRERLGVEEGWVARRYSLDRRPAFCKRASLERTGDGGLVVRNTAVVPAAAPVPATHLLAQRLSDEPFRAGHQLVFELFEYSAQGRLLVRLPALLARLRDFLLAGYDAGCAGRAGVPFLRGEALDVTWWNIIVDPESGAWHSIDGEWRFAGLLPADYVLWRGLLHTVERRRELLAGSGTEHPAQFALMAVECLYPAAGRDRLAVYEELEGAVQRAAGADTSGGEAAALSPLLGELVALAAAPRSSQARALAVPAELEAGRVRRPSGETVSIVIPTYNRLDLTRGCLEGIAETAPGAEVIVVDNGSTDGTREFLLAEQSAGRLRCLLNEENLGFGKACNRAAALSDRELVLLLNNDVVPRPGWLDAMVAELDDPTVGIVGSRLLYPDGRIQHAGGDFARNGETEHVHRFAAGDDPAVVVSRDCPVVTGASLLVRRSLYEALGGFDEGYFMYVEDVDICIRAWHVGYRVRYCAESVLVHYESSSSPSRGWCAENLVDGWARFHERWLGRMPEPVLRLTRVPDVLAGRRRFVVVARAGELAADERLLAAYGSFFDARDDVTLTILDGLREGGVPAELAAAVDRAGLSDDASADLLAVPCESAVGEHLVACGADAVYSRAGLGAAFAQLPAFDDRTVAGLRALAAHGGGVAAAA